MNILVSINNKSFGTVPETKVIGNIFTWFISDINFMSDDAIKKLLSGIFELAIEIELGALLSKKLAQGRKILKKYDREIATKFIIDQFLSSEGMSTLSGFGLAVCERGGHGNRRLTRKIPINPEKTFINGLVV